jgi:hypothetical protein
LKKIFILFLSPDDGRWMNSRADFGDYKRHLSGSPKIPSLRNGDHFNPGFTSFPGPEALIRENEVIFPGNLPDFTSVNQRSYLGAFGRTISSKFKFRLMPKNRKKITQQKDAHRRVL